MRGVFQLLPRMGQVWDNLEMKVGGLFLTVSVLLMFFEIIGRSLFGHSTIGADEMASICIIWSTFFTASLAIKKDVHIRIDILPQIIPIRYARALDAAGTLAVTLFAAYLTYSGMALVRESYLIGEVMMTSLRMPLWIPHLIIPIGGILLVIRLLQRLVFIYTPGYLERHRETEGISPH